MKKQLSDKTRLAVVTAAALISLLPVIFILFNSFMSGLEAESRYTSLITPYSTLGTNNGAMHYVEMGLLPEVLTLSGYKETLLESPSNLRFIWNSIILTIPIVLGQLFIAPLAAYGFERARSRHKEKLFFAYIITMLMPLQAVLVPHFIAARMFGIDGNYLAIILPAVFSPFGVFLLRQQMKGFGMPLIEAANTDGASELRVFFKVVLPNMKPTMIALTVLAFADAWNIVDQAVVFLKNQSDMPMSVYLSSAVTDNVGLVFAISSLFMIPALIVFIYGQDHLAEGINYSGLK